MDWNFIFNIEDGQWHPENWPSTSDPHSTVNHTHFFEADPSWIDSWPTDPASGDIPETAPPGDLTNARETLHLNPQEISEPSPTALNPPPSPQPQRRQPSSPPNSGGSPQKKRKHQRKTKTSPKEKRQRKKSTNRGEGTTSAASAAAAAAAASSSSSHHHRRHHQPPFPLSPIQTAFPPPPQSTRSPNHISNSTTGASTTTTTTTTTANTTATTNTPTTAPRPASVDLTVASPTARLPHKAVEKKYRDGIKALFRRLRLALPAGPPPSPPRQLRQDGRASSPPSLTKAGIIARAIEYIHQLEAEGGAARQRCEELTRENEGLRRRVRELEEEKEDEDEQQQQQIEEAGMREAVAGFSGVFDAIAGPAAGAGDAGAQGRQQRGFDMF